MAYDKTNLERLAGGTTSIHAYTTTADAKAAVIANGYFNSATDNLRKGDFILANCSDGAQLVVVTSATGAAAVTTAAVA